MIIVNGHELPDIPVEYDDQYYFKSVIALNVAGAEILKYMLVMTKSEQCFVPKDVNENPNGYDRLYGTSTGHAGYYLRDGNNEWTDGATYTEVFQSPIDNVEYTLVWANHDIVTATNRTSYGKITLGTDVYFKGSDITYHDYDEVYYAKSEWFKSLADLVRKLHNTDKKLTSETILIELENYNLPYIEGVKF